MSDLANQPETGTGRLELDLGRRLVAEALGTGLLTVAVVGSGIMASRLSPEDVGLQLLENAARAFETEGVRAGDGAERESELLQKIGELTVERDFLSRGLGRLK